jgi:hypothetical protein
MTPKQVVTIDFSEITKIEITCHKCGASLVFPVPTETGGKFPPLNYRCPGCDAGLWGDMHDAKYGRVYNLVTALGQWAALKGQGFSLSFSLNSN